MENEALTVSVQRALKDEQPQQVTSQVPVQEQPKDETEDDKTKPEKQESEQIKWTPINRVLQKWQTQGELSFSDLVKGIITDLEELIEPNQVERAKNIKEPKVEL